MENTGWRKPTPELVRANTLAKEGEACSVPRNQAIIACKRVAPAIGLRAGDLLVLDALVAFSHPKDWDAGARPIVWPSNDFLMDRTGLSLSAVKRRSRRLCELGLITYRDSSNGKRYGHRDAHGRIVEAFGFDLSPLAARVAEFEALNMQLQEERALCYALKRKITVARRTVRSLVETAIERLLSGDWRSIVRRLEALLSSYVPHRASVDQLAAAHEAFDTLLQETEDSFKEALKANERFSAQEIKNTEKMNSKEFENDTHIPITTEPNNVKSSSNEKIKKAPTASEQPKIVSDGRNDALGFSDTEGERGPTLKPVEIPVIMQACPGFADMARGVQPYLNNWRDLEYVADRLRPTIGISEDAWLSAKSDLGAPKAAAAFALITDKYSHGEVSSPGGYLRGLIGKAQRGELNLERSFYGRLSAKQVRM
ncbi:MAG: plasmid replication protein RepC [Pseudomonadota bacterium]